MELAVLKKTNKDGFVRAESHAKHIVDTMEFWESFRMFQNLPLD